MKLTHVGVDVAKHVFQLYGVNRSERAVWRSRLSRDRWLQVVCEMTEPGCEMAWKHVAVRTAG
jgi:hypothetical protein